MWQKAPYGLSLPYVWNSMTRDAYAFLRRNIHFANNTLQQPEGTDGYDPLFKVRYPLDAIGKGLQKVMLAFEVYCGNKDKKTDGTAVDVCDRLVNEAELTRPCGRTLYIDNYYTSVKLAKHLFEKYRWTMVGTIVPTDKKTREDHDIPFFEIIQWSA
jgi:hypothetical protein